MEKEKVDFIKAIGLTCVLMECFAVASETTPFIIALNLFALAVAVLIIYW
jgi:hypothetical protein